MRVQCAHLPPSRMRACTLANKTAGAKEAKIEAKIAQEKDKNDKIAKLKVKQVERKAVKVGKKEKLQETLKSNVKAKKGGKGGKKEEAAGEMGEGGGAAQKKRRVSWGTDQERKFES